MKSKIGILGGSFDPIHFGHVAMAQLVLDELNVDEILFIPTLQNPLKNPTQTDYEHRCNMIELALKPKMRLEKNDSIYTIDLIQQLKSNYPKTAFYFIIGDDSLQNLAQWKNIDELVKLVQFVVISRDNKISETPYDVIKLNLNNHQESSTAIRSGEFKYLDEKVRNYIFDHQLYLENIVKNHVNEKRFIHTLGVVKKAIQLCEIHQKDEVFKKDMYMAALLHDICKNFDESVLKQYMEQHFPLKMYMPIPIWHAYVGSFYIQEKLCITNKRIINAIYNHTVVEEINDFNLILKLADNLEENRKTIFEDVNDLANKDLFKAFMLLESKYN